MSEQPSDGYPEEFIQYAREKFRSQRDTIEYDARFGPPALRGWARMVLAAVEGDKTDK